MERLVHLTAVGSHLSLLGCGEWLDRPDVFGNALLAHVHDVLACKIPPFTEALPGFSVGLPARYEIYGTEIFRLSPLDQEVGHEPHVDHEGLDAGNLNRTRLDRQSARDVVHQTVDLPDGLLNYADRPTFRQKLGIPPLR
ncbi:hypothetical protein [Streptomyces sp. NPDC002785]|uniref:hypothetical protein n=1 Tax=Streptomyces sp. NPDC002785 TaxID=3154543 RepID=UPI003329B524